MGLFACLMSFLCHTVTVAATVVSVVVVVAFIHFLRPFSLVVWFGENREEPIRCGLFVHD